MLQRTFEIKTVEQAAKIAGELKKLPGIEGSPSLLKVFVFGFSYDETRELISPIRQSFPEMIITGMTIYMAKAPEDTFETITYDEEPVLRLGFFFFESSDVSILSFDLDTMTAEDALLSVRSSIAGRSDVKGVCVTLSGFCIHISDFLDRLTSGFEDIPFFGTMADVYYISNRTKNPFIFNNDNYYENGMIFLLFTGDDLHIDMQYIFGWKPIGKAMSITVSDQPPEIGDTAIAAIDGMPPKEIYRKYLGVNLDEYLTANTCEFPLVAERNGLLMGRTPLSCTDKGEIILAGSIHPDEKVRFSYTVRDDLIANTYKRSCEMAEFSPQAIEMFICGNRAIMLRSDADVEIDHFRSIIPHALHCSAAGEIYYHHGKGELLNSALVTVGFREGEPEKAVRPARNYKAIHKELTGEIPLSERILKFLQAMSGDIIEYAKKAQQANEAKSAFLANMSHDIRTPINAVLGMNEMIQRECEDESILSYSDKIRSAGNTLLGLINDILDFSKIEAGKLDIIPVDYDITSVLNDLVTMIKLRADAKGLRLETSINSDMPRLLHGDEIRIKQIITNILTNAVKYTEKGTVTFRVSYEKKNENSILLMVSIADTGIGIRKEDLPKLFSEFDRIDEKRNRSIEGTGLGMSITRRLLSMMNGRLDVESEYGKGSVFSFEIEQKVIKWEPVGRLEDALRRSMTTGAKYTRKFTAPEAQLLIVDDTPMNLEVFVNLLKKTRVKIDTAESGAECLALAAAKKYDIIFLDHMMPHKDGIETLGELKAMADNPNRDTPVICLTANAISGSREMYLDIGFDDYLAKPVDPMQLEQMIADHLPKEKIMQEDAANESHEENEISTVLVIDDDKIIRMAAENILSPYYKVISCGDGIKGIRKAEETHPDLILLDIYLADRSGFEILEKLRSNDRTREIPVMFITGDISEETEVKALQCGASDYVRKPFVSEVLLQRSKRVIDLYHFQRGLRQEIGRQTERADRLSLEMMIALSKTVDAKDHYTNGHSGRVAEYAAEIARRMGKSFEEQEKIYEMGLMHDIGKIGVREEIINKTTSLTDEEFEQIKKHTVIGYDILSSITEMPDLSAGARSHHEKYNGTGYPDGLKGKEIPETARIICVADCYDAMTSTRTYSRPKAQADVRQEIERCSGSQFDPEIAAVMLQMIDEDTRYVMNEQGNAGVWKNRNRLWSIIRSGENKEQEEPQLPQLLYEIQEIDTVTGLTHCGNAETYLAAITTYAETVQDAADEIELLLSNRDTENAAVKIHAIKSTSRLIGAVELGALAEELELAGKSGDTEKLYSRHEELLTRIRALGNALSPFIKKEALPLISKEELNEAYTLIREFMSVEDYESTIGVIESLKEYSYPDSEIKRCLALKKAAADFDYDKIAEITDISRSAF